MKRLSILIFSLISFLALANAQIFVDNQGNVIDQRNTEQQKVQTKKQQPKASTRSNFDKKRLEFGGNLGLQFGNYTSVNISPQVGYKFSNYFSAGAGLGYSYFNQDGHNYDITEHFASFNLYGTFYPVSFLVFSVKPEISRMWQTTEYMRVKSTYSKFVPSVVVGGGLRFGPMMAQIKYDVVQDDFSPYGNRVFYSIGYTFGL